jgi:signal transduction histidine kinase
MNYMFLKTRRKNPFDYLYFGISIICILIGAISSYLAYQNVDSNQKAHIIDRANTIAQTISPEEVLRLSGDETDLTKPAYIHLKNTIVNVRNVNSDIRFIYLIGTNSTGELFFMLDSEDPNSEDYSPPGQVYDEASPEMFAILSDGENRTDGPTRDRWGVWVSGYAPIRDTEGNIIALLGMDTPANEHIFNNFAYASIPLLATLIVLLILFFMKKIGQKEIAYVNMREEFLSIASHEIRNPLLGIRWALEHTLKRTGAQMDAESKSVIELVYKNSVKLIKETNELLSLKSLKDAGAHVFQNEKIILSDLFLDIIESLTLSARQHQISLVIDHGLTERKTTDASHDHAIYADYKNIRHVFLNLISNAIKYSKPNTRVFVSHKKENEDGKNWNVFEITDQGLGMSPEDAKHIFDGYYRSEKARKSSEVGTGLGLYLSKRIIDAMGGRIIVKSVLNKGSTFIVKIPNKHENTFN